MALNRRETEIGSILEIWLARAHEAHDSGEVGIGTGSSAIELNHCKLMDKPTIKVTVRLDVLR